MSRTLRALASCALGLALGCKPEAKRPNVLFISIDTLRADHLGTYGYPRGTSPEIDAFATTACVFDAAQSAASWTLPSLASLMTSLYSTTHGCWKLQSRLEPEFTTLAEVLRDAGYDTAMVVPHLFLSAQYGLQQGFTHVDATLIRTAADSDPAISSPRIPLVLRAPGIAPRRVPDVVSGVDVMPTLLDLCRVPAPSGSCAEIEGKSFVDLLRGEMEAPREALSEVRWHEEDGQDMRALR